MEELISVIVPIYNVEPYLRRCIDSILVQTYRNFELILVDDGSPDNCGTICDEYAREEARIQVIHKPNGGLSSARNAGIDIAKGEYLTFIDSDDCVYPNYLEYLYGLLKKYDADVSICDFIGFSTENMPEQIEKIEPRIRAFSGKEAYLYIRKTPVNIISACLRLYHRKLFAEVRYPPGKIMEDFWVTAFLYYDINRIVATDEILYCYFQNPKGIINSEFTLQWYDEAEACDAHIRFFEEKGEEELKEHAEFLKGVATARCSLKARTAGVYQQVPAEYRMNKWKAAKIVKKIMSENEYECFMYYNGFRVFIKLRAYWKKIIKIFCGSQKGE